MTQAAYKARAKKLVHKEAEEVELRSLELGNGQAVQAFHDTCLKP